MGVSDLEKRCIKPGLWIVEGQRVKKLGRSWFVTGSMTQEVMRPFRTFREVQEWVADRLEQQRST